jgi:hypothetical protein
MLDSVYANSDEVDAMETSVSAYYKLSPYYSAGKLHELETQKLRKMIMHLRDVIVGMESTRMTSEHDIRHATKTVSIWQYVVYVHLHCILRRAHGFGSNV